MFKPFPELDSILSDFVQAVRAILDITYVGTYLQGSFALGAGDLQSDCDFVVVTSVAPSGERERQLRLLHADIPTRPGAWNQNLEGCYADATSLATIAGLGAKWLYVDRGHRDMSWSNHDNSLHTRWILRHHGITLDGPPIRGLLDEVPAAALREAARRDLPGTLEEIRTWANMDNAWTQRYVVETYCRVLYTMRTGEVSSKPAALEWAMEACDPTWRPLLRQVAEDRTLQWKPVDPPRPGSMERAYAFASYVEGLAL